MKNVQIQGPGFDQFRNFCGVILLEKRIRRESERSLIYGNKPALALVKTVLYDSHGREGLLVDDDSPSSIVSLTRSFSLLLFEACWRKIKQFGRRIDFVRRGKKSPPGSHLNRLYIILYDV